MIKIGCKSNVVEVVWSVIMLNGNRPTPHTRTELPLCVCSMHGICIKSKSWVWHPRGNERIYTIWDINTLSVYTFQILSEHFIPFQWLAWLNWVLSFIQCNTLVLGMVLVTCKYKGTKMTPAQYPFQSFICKNKICRCAQVTVGEEYPKIIFISLLWEREALNLCVQLLTSLTKSNHYDIHICTMIQTQKSVIFPNWSHF